MESSFAATSSLYAAAVPLLLLCGCNQPPVQPKQESQAAASSSTIPSLPTLQALVQSQTASANMANQDPAGYAWDLFFYTNWPSLTSPDKRGVPDPSKSFGQPGPVVWETWKNSFETYPLDTKQPPPPWGTAEPVPPPVQQQPTQPSNSGDYRQHMTGNTQVDGFSVSDDRDREILYEIRQNQSTFDYILTNKLFSIDGQIAFAKTSGPLQFYWSALEVKAAWRWLDTDKAGCQPGDYFTANAYWQDANGNYKTGLMGLTGLHIISKALPQWVWITFEQVNNTSCTQATRRDPIPTNIAALNQKMQSALAGTKWKNYELVGVQTSAGTADNPVLLANTQIETAFQSRSSCLTCHAIANIARQKPPTPADNLRKSFLQAKPPVSPPYYIGPPPALEPFQSQDFVWSLRRAH